MTHCIKFSHLVSNRYLKRWLQFDFLTATSTEGPCLISNRYIKRWLSLGFEPLPYAMTSTWFWTTTLSDGSCMASNRYLQRWLPLERGVRFQTNHRPFEECDLNNFNHWFVNTYIQTYQNKKYIKCCNTYW